MLTLLTKDGTKTGNAIIYDGDDGISWERMIGEFSEPKPLFYVETDFGNRMKLTWREIEDWFTIGRIQDYKKWKQDQADRREQNEIEDINL